MRSKWLEIPHLETRWPTRQPKRRYAPAVPSVLKSRQKRQPIGDQSLDPLSKAGVPSGTSRFSSHSDCPESSTTAGNETARGASNGRRLVHQGTAAALRLTHVFNGSTCSIILIGAACYREAGKKSPPLLPIRCRRTTPLVGAPTRLLCPPCRAGSRTWRAGGGSWSALWPERSL